MPTNRHDRLHSIDRQEDQRSAFQRDRDRILYCSAFRRLAEVTQVVSADEGSLFHNRLTHTLKVAQIARRLAEKVTHDNPQIAETLGGINADVAEAAALAHDLGHPPFGHVIEKELNSLVTDDCKQLDGFEGNAQSFRIVNKLATRHPDQPDGLNLTRATLNAILKYPWHRATDGPHKKKWGAYHTEDAEFTFARNGHPLGPAAKSPEADIMDWADDIAYSVHDVEDFYRAGLIPLDRILVDRSELDRFLMAAKERRVADGIASATADKDNELFTNLIEVLPPKRLDGRFRGTFSQRAGLRSITSFLVSRYITKVQLQVPATANQPSVLIEPVFRSEVAVLKELVWHYVIRNASLATQQHGQKTAVRQLFRWFMDAVGSPDWSILPVACRERVEASARDNSLEKDKARIVTDTIASMSERQVLSLYRRLSGAALGSVMDSVG